MQIKSGFKTSEFYITLVSLIGSMLVLTGVIPETDQEAIVNLVKDAIAGVVAVVGIVSYIMGRVEVKKEAIRTQKVEELG